MFSLFNRKKNPVTVDLSGLRCDMHSHLIPGIDDGVPDMDTAVEMIRNMMALGYQKLITTPHVQWDMFKNTPEIIRSGFEAVKGKLAAEKIAVEFEAAAEYFMDDHFEDLLKTDQPLLTLKGNMVLVEFSFIQQPPDLKELLFKLQIKGYQPVLAHPERYLYFGARKEWYDEIKELNCLFQVNLLSLCGFYGKKQEELAQYLIRKKYVNLLGTDLHNARHIHILRSSSTIMESVQKLLDAGALLNPDL
jgi:protein-tyrosine phosphatase